MYRVFRLPASHAAKVDLLFQDDLVSRQSVTVRDAKSLGLGGDDRYVIVEGTETAIGRAAELLKDVGKALPGTKGDRVYQRVRAQDEDAVSGIGMIFGP